MSVLSYNISELKNKANSAEGHLGEMFRGNGVRIKDAKAGLNSKLNGSLKC